MIKASEKTWTGLYRNLGYLFYAIAAADKHIMQEEMDELHEEIKARWLGLENTKDDFGTDAAFEIEFVFDWIRENALSSDAAYHHFERFYHENVSLFTPDVVERIYATSAHIASSFHGSNKQELAILFKLHTLLGSVKH